MTSLCLHVDAQFASPYAMSVFVALHEKALAFEMATVDLGAGEQHAAVFAALSLTRRVPALVHDGFALSESSAITEYIDEVFEGHPLYPTQPRDKARARQVQAWLRSDLMPLRQERPTEVLFYGARPPALSATAQEAAAKLCAAAQNLLQEGAKHLFGQWSIADVDLALMLNRLILSGEPVPRRLETYAAHQWLRPTVQMWIDQRRPPL
ncbi:MULTISPECIES: glutathione transferase [unclassified Variovorax]|uniref:glutathione transferase n=1 Tax=unclassified Variovorax TaxID=663243 RepID=UPI001BD204D4|nr:MULTISPECIES: glutathione transferase [unclassified Variovorax]